MIKLAIVITGLSTGGAEMMLLKLLQHLDRERFSVSVISLTTKGEVGAYIEALGIPVIALGMSRGVPNPLLLFKLTKHIRKFQPDIVHTWMYHADLLGGLAARLAGVHRVIWGIRHSNLSKTENKRSTLMVVKVCAWLSHWLPYKILSCSNRATQVHIDVGYQAEKLSVIPNGFDLSRFQPDLAAREAVRSELGLDANALLAGVVARFDPQKNHLGFIDAASRLHRALPQVHFVLAGKDVDSSNSALMQAISTAGLGSFMHLLGRRDDIPRLMAAFDVLASPSHGEAFPNVLGEAMACGVPCVVTDAGDSAEIVADTGRVVAVGDMKGLADEMFSVLSLSSADRAELGIKARTRVQDEYEIDHVAALYQAFYQHALAE